MNELEEIMETALENSVTVESSPLPDLEVTTQPTDKSTDFNPEIHAVDENGQPKLTKTGAYAKKRGRNKGSSSKLASEDVAKEQALLQAQAIEEQKYRAVGAMSTMMLTNTLTVIFSEEFKATENEKIALDSAFSEYYKSKEMQDLSPNAALTIVIMSYVLPRLTMPKTKTKLQILKEKIVLFIYNIKHNKEKKAKQKELEKSA